METLAFGDVKSDGFEWDLDSKKKKFLICSSRSVMELGWCCTLVFLKFLRFTKISYLSLFAVHVNYCLAGA